MHTRIISSVGVVLACWAGAGMAEDVVWQPSANPGTPTPGPVALGRPQPLTDAPPRPAANPVRLAAPVPLNSSTTVRCQAEDPAPSSSLQATYSVIRAQADPPPPPAFGPPGGPAPYTPVPSGNLYPQGVVNNDSDLGGFWSRTWDQTKRCWSDVTGSVGGAFQGGDSRRPFQSDREFEVFTSPVTNPFYFEDPRALTEIRPIFIWEHTPSSNPVWHGGNNFALDASGSVALTPYISLVLNRFGFYWIDPHNGAPEVTPHGGFSEIMLGPKITFLRSETSNTVAAVGLTFDLPAGSSNNLQDTGHLMLIPYVSVAQNFGKSSYGSFNFMNTTGYNFRTDNTRSESFFSSFHLDYEIAKTFYPLIELNWRHYTRNGNNEPFNFEGNDLANFGSEHVSGFNDLTLAFGMRYKINNNIQFGIAFEFNTLGNSDGRHLDEFRLTTDFIFRY